MASESITEVPFTNSRGDPKYTFAVIYSGNGLAFISGTQDIFKCNISGFSQGPVWVATRPSTTPLVELASDHEREVLFVMMYDYGIIQLPHSGGPFKVVASGSPKSERSDSMQVDPINQ